MKTAMSLIMVLSGFISTSAFSQQKTKSQQRYAQVTLAERQDMALVHESVAACLRSTDNTMETCHKEMMKSCKDMMGKRHCMMMEKDTTY